MATNSNALRRPKAGARALATVSVAMVMFVGCKASVHVGNSEIAKADVETEAATQLAATVKQPTPKVTCPGGLSAKVGATIDCDLVAQGETVKYPVHIVVDSVKGGTAHFTVEVGQSPEGEGGSSTSAP